MKSAISKVILIILLIAGTAVFAQETGSPLREGLNLFGESKFSEALRTFRDIIIDPSLEDSYGDAYYWIARCHLAMDDLDNAEKSLEFYLLNYPEHPLYSEAYYQKGRLLFLQQEYRKSIQVLYDFIDTYPDSPFISNGYFWIGESLFSLGALEDAKRVFQLIPEKFPASFKVEAARYRVSLIELKEREEVLLDMIQMSHEEYIKVLEEFQMRERTYKQALDIYQKKLADAATADKDGTISTLRSKLADREDELSDLKDDARSLQAEIESLREQLQKTKSDLAAAQTALQEGASEEAVLPEQPVQPVATTFGSGAEQLLELKSRVLDVKEYYLNWLTAEMEED